MKFHSIPTVVKSKTLDPCGLNLKTKVKVQDNFKFFRCFQNPCVKVSGETDGLKTKTRSIESLVVTERSTLWVFLETLLGF